MIVHHNGAKWRNLIFIAAAQLKDVFKAIRLSAVAGRFRFVIVCKLFVIWSNLIQFVEFIGTNCGMNFDLQFFPRNGTAASGPAREKHRGLGCKNSWGRLPKD